MNADGAHHQWGPQRLAATVEHIRRRADVTPTLTAVRHSGESATYRDLAESLAHYENVTRVQGLGVGSAVAAGVLHCMPGVAAGDGESVARAMSDIVEWLGRDIGDTGTGSGSLRAVG